MNNKEIDNRIDEIRTILRTVDNTPEQSTMLRDELAHLCSIRRQRRANRRLKWFVVGCGAVVAVAGALTVASNK